MALVDEIKIAIGGISHNKLDEEIKAVAMACKSDLRTGGVNVLIDTDPLLKQAVKLYARWYFNFQGAGDNWLDTCSLLSTRRTNRSLALHSRIS